MGACPLCGAHNPPQAVCCRHCGAGLGAGPGGGGPAPAGGPASAIGRRRAWLAALIAVAFLAAIAAVVAFVVLDRGSPQSSLASLRWTIIGASVEGRPIEAASFGSGARRRVLVIGGVHGGEDGASAAVQLAEYLHVHPEEVPASATIDIIRCLNPDAEAAGTRGNAHDVDLNRNMPTADWRGRLSPIDQSRGKFHCNGGTSPGSEPEVQALFEQLDKGYDAVLSLHSHGGFPDANGPGGRGLARRISAVCGLKLDTVPYDAYITAPWAGTSRRSTASPSSRSSSAVPVSASG